MQRASWTLWNADIGAVMIPTLQLVVTVTMALLAGFVAGLRDDPALGDGLLELNVNNSHFLMRTRRIDRVVALGPIALGPLVGEMNRPGVTLDTFARCYTARDQILLNAGLKEAVRWYGGSIRTDETGRVTGIPRTDGFSERFRKDQIEDIVRRAKEVRISLDRGR
jgi:hypothetical protein